VRPTQAKDSHDIAVVVIAVLAFAPPSSIRTRLQMDRRTRDLAMFNLAIDSKLRGCDVVALRVEDVASSGYAVDRATVVIPHSREPHRLGRREWWRVAAAR
jgi:hypothetical protein